MKIAFLVLNYRNVSETIKCIQSIQALELSEYCIVVVDNGSEDESLKKLEQLYSKVEKIHLISSNENLGFSKGNNLGYSFIRENYNADFVVITNNDVLFPQKDFERRLNAIYNRTHFMVYGPDIYARMVHEHQSPMMLSLPTKEELKKELSMYEYYSKYPEKWVKRRKVQVLKNRLCQSSNIINKIYAKARFKSVIDSSKCYEECCVQGACIIISKEYLQTEEKMFSPEPFLYCEELLLFAKCKRKGYKIVYDPLIQIWHEDSSTIKKISGNALEKAKFTLPHHVAARKIVLDYLE